MIAKKARTHVVVEEEEEEMDMDVSDKDEPNPPYKILFVQSLPKNTTVDMLTRLFQQYFTLF